MCWWQDGKEFQWGKKESGLQKQPFLTMAKEWERQTKGEKSLEGDWHERKEKIKAKKKKKNNVEDGRTHIPLLQHKSPGESDHGTSCRTGLLIRHSNSHTLRLTQTQTHSFGTLPPCAQSVQTVWLMGKTEGIPMSEPMARPLCTCKSLCRGCSSVQHGSHQGTMEKQHPWFVTSSSCHTFQEVCAKGTSGNKAFCDATWAATPAAFRSETTHNAAHTKLARNTLNAITVRF